MSVNDHRSTPAGQVLHVEAFRRYVSNLDRSIEFYCGALGFELDRVRIHAEPWTLSQVKAPRLHECAVLALGSERLELIAIEPGAEKPAFLGMGRRACSLDFQHFAIVTSNMHDAFARILRFAPKLISNGGPALLPPPAGSVITVKFRDPDGHPLELIWFPAGTGEPRWQRHSTAGSTLGIDHTAIVVTDADRSIAFYREMLGCRVASRQKNRGPAQDRLDGLVEVEVDVVALNAALATTPHLELLGYQIPQPSDGARGGSPSRYADCIVWAAAGITPIASALAAGGHVIAERPERRLGRDEWLLQDPDGHLHVLVSRP
jgi:catechol 2,3-dioxygenase-like lactoylglutathione lyase family enzyme